MFENMAQGNKNDQGTPVPPETPDTPDTPTTPISSTDSGNVVGQVTERRRQVVLAPGTRLACVPADSVVMVDEVLGGNGIPVTLVMFAPSRSNPLGFSMTKAQIERYMKIIPNLTYVGLDAPTKQNSIVVELETIQ